MSTLYTCTGTTRNKQVVLTPYSLFSVLILLIGCAIPLPHVFSIHDEIVLAIMRKNFQMSCVIVPR